MRTVIVDVMGGDNAPLEMLKGAIMAKNELFGELDCILVGDEKTIERVAGENDISLEGVRIAHAKGVIDMTDDPMSIVRGKSDCSMAVGLRMLKGGEGDAFVSAGNTGALFTGASLIVRRVKGVKRAAIAALLPMQTPVLLLDSGANVRATPEYLEQFALMGSAYMRRVIGLESPRVGLLNNGAEENKGNDLCIKTYSLLEKNKSINFVGNIEGTCALRNVCDVIVTDGFTGNIFLKAMEGFGNVLLKSLKDTLYKNFKTKIAALMIKDELGDMKKSFDAGELGGAPILGVAKPVIKAHGSSDARAFKNAIKQAAEYAVADVNNEIELALADAAQSKDTE